MTDNRGQLFSPDLGSTRCHYIFMIGDIPATFAFCSACVVYPHRLGRMINSVKRRQLLIVSGPPRRSSLQPIGRHGTDFIDRVPYYHRRRFGAQVVGCVRSLCTVVCLPRRTVHATAQRQRPALHCCYSRCRFTKSNPLS